MSSAITITVSDAVLTRLRQVAVERKLTPEEVASGELEQAWLKWFVDSRRKPVEPPPPVQVDENDPLLRLIGSFDSGDPDAVERDDHDLGMTSGGGPAAPPETKDVR